MYSISMACALVFSFIPPLIIIYLILRRIPILDDAIGLKKELQIIAYYIMIYIIVNIFDAVVKPIIERINKDFQQYDVLNTILSHLLYRFADFGINYMSTGWINKKFKIILRPRPSLSGFGSSAISLPTRKLRNVVHASSLHLMEDVGNAIDEEQQAEA